MHYTYTYSLSPPHRPIQRVVLQRMFLNVIAHPRFAPTRSPSSFHSTDMMKLLIDRGADAFTSNDEGWTALVVCQDNGHDESAALIRSAIESGDIRGQVTDGSLERAFSTFDTDGDGEIDVQEFARAVRSNAVLARYVCGCGCMKVRS